MRKFLIVTVLTLAALVGSEKPASACWYVWGYWNCGSAVYCGYPYGDACGHGAGCYYYAPYYGWFGQYNYAQSPYAWPQGYVAGRYPAHLPPRPGHYPQGPIDRFGLAPTAQPATVVATLPADAELHFNGVPATGATGTTRSFRTGPLTPGQRYEYTVTATVTRDGKLETVTQKVIVKAGEESKVTLQPATGLAVK